MIKMRVKAAGLAAMAIIAAYLGVWAISDVGAGVEKPDYYMEAVYVPEGTQYVLREYEGHVGVFAPGSAGKPQDLTEIETSSLRASDRKLLQGGIPVSSRDELLSLLEDLGS